MKDDVHQARLRSAPPTDAGKEKHRKIREKKLADFLKQNIRKTKVR